MKNVLMISTDKGIFAPGSRVRSRMAKYGTQCDQLRIVVVTRKGDACAPTELAPNVSAYPTGSKFKFLAIFDAMRIASTIIAGEKEKWVISCQDPYETGIVGYVLRRRLEVPLQLQVHTDLFSPYFGQMSIVNRIRVKVATFLLPRADAIRVVSERIRASIVERFSYLEPRIVTIPIFVDVAHIFRAAKRARSKAPVHQKTVLMMSRLSSEKDIELGIRAFVAVAKRMEGIQLVIVGDGPKRQALERLVNRLNGATMVKFAPWQDDTLAHYAVADVFMSTSRYEGYGMTFLEAVAAGLTVVATDVGIAPELAASGAPVTVVPVGDREACEAALEQALKERRHIDTMATIPLTMRATEGVHLKKLISAFTITFRPTLCYVLPEYQEHDATHMRHLHSLIELVRDRLDILMMVERGSAPGHHFGVRAAWLLPQGMWRIPATLARMLLARLDGCTRFYVHYSFAAALSAIVVRKLFGGTVWYWNCGEPWKYERRPARRRIERFTYRHIDYLVTGTQSLAKAYTEHYPLSFERTRALANWIEVDAWQTEIKRLREEGVREKVRTSLGLDASVPLILFVHRLSDRKGAQLIPEIVARLANRKATAVVIGEGPLRLDLKREVEGRGLNNRVRFTGALPNDALPRYYAAADALLMPSFEEGFPHVLIEGMAAGLPFVATRVGGVSDIIPTTFERSLVNAGDVAAAATVLDEVLKLPGKKRAQKEGQLQRWVRRYDVRHAAQAFIDLIYDK